MATIRKKQVDLGEQNVILVDAVGGASGPQVVRTLRVERTLPSGGNPSWIGETLRSSPEIVSFLRCDTPIEDPLAQKLSQIVCASVLGQ